MSHHGAVMEQLRWGNRTDDPFDHVVNVASVPQRSPFRYPGGKTWLVPEIRAWLRSLPIKPKILVEPFAGGGIASLTSVCEGLVEKAVLVELDPHVAAAWRLILEDEAWLTEHILAFKVDRDSVLALLAKEPEDWREKGFQAIVRNRVQRGGIMAPGASLMKNGENGRGISSRWYPQTIARRIHEIHRRRDRITFIEGDGLEAISAHAHDPKVAFFVDPPYTAGGKKAGRRLYAHNDVNHEALFASLAQVAGKTLLTYDEAPEVLALAIKYGFQTQRVPMKNTHHAKVHELLLTCSGGFVNQEAFA